MVELFHFPPSLCSQKVRLALAEKGVAYDARLVNIGPVLENYEPWYARINPRMVVPTLVVGDRVVASGSASSAAERSAGMRIGAERTITDSARIVVFVDEHFDGPDLRAASPQVQRWVALQDGLKIREIAYAPTGGLIGFLSKGSFDKRVVALERHRDANPELAALYQARLDDVAQWQETSLSTDQVAALRAQVVAALGEVEARLEQGPFLVGETYTLADVVWTVLLARCVFMKLDAHWGPATRAYYGRMKARPSFHGADVWERPKPAVMLPLIAQVVKMRLGLG